jgi:hypothetical protein
MIYMISSHWDMTMSGLDGNEYDTYEEAWADLVHRGHEDMVVESVDHGCEQAWLVYASQDDADGDGDGRGAIAQIETVSDEGEDES